MRSDLLRQEFTDVACQDCRNTTEHMSDGSQPAVRGWGYQAHMLGELIKGYLKDGS